MSWLGTNVLGLNPKGDEIFQMFIQSTKFLRSGFHIDYVISLSSQSVTISCVSKRNCLGLFSVILIGSQLSGEIFEFFQRHRFLENNNGIIYLCFVKITL